MTVYAIRQLYPQDQQNGQVTKDPTNHVGADWKERAKQVAPKVWWVFSDYMDVDGQHALVWRVQEMTV